MQGKDKNDGASGNEVAPQVPDRLHASDFKIANATFEGIMAFERMLNYLQDGSTTATAILKSAWLSGVTIGLNPYNETIFTNINNWNWTGKDVYLETHHVVLWNPNSALQVTDAQGNVIGVLSAAVSGLHEFAHSIDKQVAANLASPDPQYKNLAEYIATRYENMVAAELGEPIRDFYKGGIDLWTPNVTLHTGLDANGVTRWVQEGEYGLIEYGEEYDFKKIPPIWDSPGHAPQYGSSDPAPHGFPDGVPARNDEGGSPPPGTYGGGGGEGTPSGHGDGDPYNGDGWPSEYDPGANGGGSNGGGWDGTSDPYDDGPSYDGDYGGGYGGDYGGGYGDYGGGGGGGFGCVATSSFLPDGRTAGDIRVGDTMVLGDQETMEPGTGVVSFSQTKEARGYRITTESGVSLVCSDTAPIPARGKGLLNPDKLLGEQVAVRRGDGGQSEGGWETVTKVEEVGIIKVQHITVGNKCFWAGEKNGAYILHHNMKDAGGGDDCWPDDDWIPLRADPKPDESQQTAQRGDHGAEPTQLVGVSPPPVVDGISYI